MRCRGHTDGHSSLVAGEVLFAGDAICTLNPLTGKRGPQLMPGAFNNSTAVALASVNRLAGTGTTVVLPGHGERWDGRVHEAVELVKRRGPT